MMQETKFQSENNIEKDRLKNKLDQSLLSNPPQVSKLSNCQMVNYLQSVDADNNERIRWWVLQTLTDLDRFNRKFNVITKIDPDQIDLDDINCIKAYAKDFYAAWHASSSEVIRHLGWKRSLDIFRALRPWWFEIWPHDAFMYLEECNFPNTHIVFRGESKEMASNGVNGKASWSLSRDIACYYASRHADGVLHEGEVSFENVLFFQTEEFEVVVNPGTVLISNTVDIKLTPRCV